MTYFVMVNGVRVRHTIVVCIGSPMCDLVHDTAFYQDNMSVWFIPPYTQLSNSKTEVYRGINFFLIFALKHSLWELVRTASVRRFKRVPTIYVLSKIKKNITIFYLKIIIIYSREISQYIAWACLRNDTALINH